MEEEFISLNQEQNSCFPTVIDIKEEPELLISDSDESGSSTDMEEFISLNPEQNSSFPPIIHIKEEPELIISDSDESDHSIQVGDESCSETSSIEVLEVEPKTSSEDEGMVSKLSIPPINDCSLICTKCSESLENVHHLNMHYFKEHNIRSVEDLNFTSIDRGTGDCYYQCLKCPKNFKGKKLLFLHSTQHDTIRMFRCDNCCRHFSYYKNIIAHNCRKAKKKYGSLFWKHVKRLCPSCGKEYTLAKDLKQHLSLDHKFHDLENINVVKVKAKKLQFKCTVCEYLFKTRLIADFRTHAFSHMPYKLYNCQQCPIAFDTEDEMMAHLGEHHQINAKSRSKNKFLDLEGVELQCPECEVELPSRMAFIEHLNMEHRLNTPSGLRVKRLSKGIYKCLDCNAKLTHYSRFQHRMSHMPHKPYRCGFCKHTFAQSRGACAHLLKCKRKQLKGWFKKRKDKGESKAKAKKAQNISENLQKNKEEEEEKLQDPLSLQPTTLTEVSQVRFVYRNESTTVLNEFGDYMAYACPECNIPLANATDWHTHISLTHNFFEEDNLQVIKLADGKYQCTECGVLTESAISQRQRHKLTHMPHKSFICTLCGHRSKTCYVLFGHIRRRHFAKGEYKCSMCPEVFETSFKCVEHGKTEHSEHEYPPNCCKICMTILASSYTLKKHMDVHDYDRTVHKCPDPGCERVFLWPGEVHKHVKQKHPDLDANCVKCLFCTAKFYDQRQLDEHSKTHPAHTAKIGPTTCKFCHEFLRTAKGVKYHMKKVHSDMPRHACDYCGCQFSLLSTLRAHIEKFHSDKVFAFSSSHRKSDLEDGNEALPPITPWELENGEFEKIKTVSKKKKKSRKPRQSTRRKRGRPQKLHPIEEDGATTSSETCESCVEVDVPKRKIGRPRKPIVFKEISSNEESELTEEEEFECSSLKPVPKQNPDAPKRKRGRPRKIQTQIETPENIKCEPDQYVIAIVKNERVEELSCEIVKGEVIL